MFVTSMVHVYKTRIDEMTEFCFRLISELCLHSSMCIHDGNRFLAKMLKDLDMDQYTSCIEVPPTLANQYIEKNSKKPFFCRVQNVHGKLNVFFIEISQIFP